MSSSDEDYNRDDGSDDEYDEPRVGDEEEEGRYVDEFNFYIQLIAARDLRAADRSGTLSLINTVLYQ